MTTTLILFILGFVGLVIVAPVWIVFHYITRWKEMKTLSPEDEEMLAGLWESARKMETRIESLERLMDLDRAAPQPRSDTHGKDLN